MKILSCRTAKYATVPLLLLTWEALSATGVINSKLIPPPTRVMVTALEMIRTGELLGDVSASLWRWSLGFFYASVLGILTGLLTGRIPIFRATLQQVIQLLRPVPAISFVPLAIVWFGIGEAAKYFLVAWGAFFPIWLNTHVGAANVDRYYLWAAESLGASKMRMVATVILPAALPFIFAGLRTGIAVGFICLVAAEMAGAYEGLGFRVIASHLVFRVDKMFVALCVLGLLGALTDRLFSGAFLRLFPWCKNGHFQSGS